MVGELYIILIVIVVVLTVCIPFFILKIRNQVVEINKKMSQIVQILESQASNTVAETSEVVSRVEIDKNGNRIKIYGKCDKKNRAEDWNCIHCGEALH